MSKRIKIHPCLCNLPEVINTLHTLHCNRFVHLRVNYKCNCTLQSLYLTTNNLAPLPGNFGRLISKLFHNFLLLVSLSKIQENHKILKTKIVPHFCASKKWTGDFQIFTNMGK